MNGYIKEMIAQYVQMMEVVVTGEGQEGEKTARAKLPDTRKVMDVPDGIIVDDISFIIEMKGGIKSIGIDEEPQAGDEQYWEELDV